MPFLCTMPTTMIAPMNDEMLRVWPVTKRARSAPKPQRIVATRIAMGCENDRNSKTRMTKISRIDRSSTWVRPRNDFALDLVEAAELDLGAGRDLHLLEEPPLDLGDGRAEVAALEPGRHRGQVAQVLAVDLRLPFLHLDVGDAARAAPSGRWAR